MKIELDTWRADDYKTENETKYYGCCAHDTDKRKDELNLFKLYRNQIPHGMSPIVIILNETELNVISF